MEIGLIDFVLNEFVYRMVPAVLLILCVHCFAVKPSHHHCHIMQQKAFAFHMTYVLVLFQDTIIGLLASCVYDFV